jgi:hypothetical protein
MAAKQLPPRGERREARGEKPRSLAVVQLANARISKIMMAFARQKKFGARSVVVP